MTVDWAIVPGLLLLAAELVALAAVGYVVSRTALRQRDERLALAQGLVIGPALWGFVVNVVLYTLPAPAGVVAAWVLTLALAAGLVWRAGQPCGQGCARRPPSWSRPWRSSGSRWPAASS